jgi:hypothetical protein
MKMPDMRKENNFVLREAAKAACDGYYTHLQNGGKGDPSEERWIEALTAGADAITQVAVLEARLTQVECERDAAVADLSNSCAYCKHASGSVDEPPCTECFHPKNNIIFAPITRTKFEWRGVCPGENT